MTEERASLEREIRRLRDRLATGEAALQAQGISAKDRTWVTKQLGLRQLRVGRPAARLDALRPPRDGGNGAARVANCPNPDSSEAHRP